MDGLQFRALLAGLCFGIWPLLMNKSGLNGNVSATVFSGLVLLFVFPFAVKGLFHMDGVQWGLVVIACLLGAVGIMSFNGMLAKATPQAVSMLFVLTIIVQTSVPAIYQAVMNHGLSWTKGTGFVLAIIAAILLSLKR